MLHDLRGLSVHFLIDVDGSVYQTLDLAEQAWHARHANARSIGVELAHLGAFEPGNDEPFEGWYVEDERGMRMVVPADRAAEVAGGPGPHPLPRAGRIRGEIQGAVWEQPDYTAAQYHSLGALTRALVNALPRLEPRFPLDDEGNVETAVLEEERQARFRGIVGHHHLSANKRDPGPAFDWERLRALLDAPTP